MTVSRRAMSGDSSTGMAVANVTRPMKATPAIVKSFMMKLVGTWVRDSVRSLWEMVKVG